VCSSDLKHVRAFQQMARLTEVSNAGQMAFGTVLLVVITVLFVTLFAARNIRKFRKQARDLGLLALVMFVSLVSVKLWFWIFDAVWERFHYFNLESYYFAIPFAAGAMIFVVVEEVIPESQTKGHSDYATMGAILGFAVMMTLDVALG